MSQPDPSTQATQGITKATLTPIGASGAKGDPIQVHFNPASLVYTVENIPDQQSRSPKRVQHVAKFTGKLTMDLQFDSTDTGTDVRQDTSKIAQLMQPSADASKKAKASGAHPPAPSVLSFDWGAYHFQGFMESFKETIDFFSADGIPLRSLVSIGLARQDENLSVVAGGTGTPTGSLVPSGGGGSSSDPDPDDPGPPLQQLATQGGDPNATRALASANGIENPRFSGGAGLQVGGGIQLNAAVGFVASASAGAGIGVSGGLGIGVSAGAGIGISAGAGIGVSAGAGISTSASAGAGFGIGGGVSAGGGVSVGGSLGIGVSVSAGAGGQVTLAAGGGALFGSKASAGVPATAGAFAGLETGRATLSTTAQLDPTLMLPATIGSDVSVGASASFGLGGVALASSGFSASVGATASFTDRLTFDGD